MLESINEAGVGEKENFNPQIANNNYREFPKEVKPVELLVGQELDLFRLLRDNADENERVVPEDTQGYDAVKYGGYLYELIKKGRIEKTPNTDPHGHTIYQVDYPYDRDESRS